MGDLSRQYKPTTIKKLFLLSGNECAEPACTRRLLAKDGESIIGKICHIEAASDDGPRYNASMDDEARRHFNNLILLCDEDHTIIDNIQNENKYPVELLKEWKQSHESQQLIEKLKTKPSLLKDAINAIAKIDWNGTVEEGKLNSFDPRDKILYNSLRRSVSLINEYKSFHGKINALYEEIEKQGSFKKERLLNNIRLIYVKVKGLYVLDSNNPIEIIRLNSDNIIDDIYENIYSKIEEMKSFDEDIVLAINLVIVDAFMRCKILEEPI